jgi:DNA invertase Pin-like site-specific DNA recombinase
MNQIARNLDDLRQLVKTLNGKRIRVEFIKEHLTFKGDDSPVAALLLSVMGGLCGI